MTSSSIARRLIVLGSSITALALVRNCNAIGIECYLLDTKKGPATLSKFPEVEIFDQYDADLVLERVRSLARSAPSALVSDSDFWLRWIMKFRSQLVDDLVDILHPANDAMHTCLDKSRFLRWCAETAISAPKLYSIDSLEGMVDSDFPMLVRPEETRHGTGSEIPKALEVSNARQLLSLLEQYESQGVIPSVSESLLPRRLKQFSVGVARRSSGDTRVFVAEKVRPDASECAGGTYVVSVYDLGVATFARSICEAANLYGIAEIEILQDLDTGEMFVIEINPRPWVQYSLARLAGFDLLNFMLDPASDQQPPDTRSERSWLSFMDDLFVVMSRSQGMLRDNRVGLIEYLRSILRPNVHAVWSWRDPKPSLVGWIRRLTS